MSIFIVLLLSVLATLLDGFAFSLVWNWILVPIFHIQTLGTLAGIGVVMVLNYLFPTGRKYLTPTTDTQNSTLADMLLLYFVSFIGKASFMITSAIIAWAFHFLL